MNAACAGMLLLVVASPSADLTREQMLEDLDQLIEAVKIGWSYEEDRRLNFDVDLDRLRDDAAAKLPEEAQKEDFADVLRRFVSSMQDGHAWVRVPGVVFPPVRLWPFTLADTEEGVLVDGVAAGLESPRRGDALIAVDGRSIEEVIRAASEQVTASTPGARRLQAVRLIEATDRAEHDFRFRSAEGEEYELTLASVPRPRPARHTDRLARGIEWRTIPAPDGGSDIGYFRIGNFLAPDQEAWRSAAPEERDALIADVVAEVRTAFTELPDSRAIIIDIRHNPGGTDLIGQALAQHLVPPGSTYFILQGRDGPGMPWHMAFPVTTKEDPSVVPFAGPVAVLIDEATFSVADNFASCIADVRKDAIFIGRPTGGGTGAPREIVTLTHSGAVIGACTMRVFSPSARLIEGRGVKPHVHVIWTREDLLTSRDPDVETALRVLCELRD